MDMVKTDKLVFEYEKRDEEGNVIGMHRAVDEAVSYTHLDVYKRQHLSSRRKRKQQ